MVRNSTVISFNIWMLSRLPTSLSFSVTGWDLETLKMHLSRQAAPGLANHLELQPHSTQSLRCMEGCSKDALSNRSLRGRGPSLQYLLGPLTHSCGGWGGRADGYAVEGSGRYQSYPGVPYLGPAMLSLGAGVEHVTLKCRQ